MLKRMQEQLKEIAINEAVEICDKAGFMDKAIFYKRIKDMKIDEIVELSKDIMLTYSLRKMNLGFKVTKGKSLMRKVM